MTVMTPAGESLAGRLTGHRLLGDAPSAELAWLAERGSARTFERGQVIIPKGEVVANVSGVIALLSGRLAVYIDRGAGPKKVLEWGPGDVTGMLPYSRIATSNGQGIALESGELFFLHRDHF